MYVESETEQTEATQDDIQSLNNIYLLQHVDLSDSNHTWSRFSGTDCCVSLLLSFSKQNLKGIERNIVFFFHFYLNQDAFLLTERPSDNISAIYFTSQMGLGSQGHTSWKTDGLKRHQGHCGHNESAYVCSFTAPPHPTPFFYSSSSWLLEPPSASAGWWIYGECCSRYKSYSRPWAHDGMLKWAEC